MSDIFKGVKDSFTGMNISRLKSVAGNRKLNIAVVLCVVIVAAVTLSKFLYSKYSKIIKGDNAAESMEASFKSEYADPAAIESREDRDKVNARQCDALKSFMRREMSCKSLCDILKFGVTDLPKHARDNGEVILNPEILDDEYTFDRSDVSDDRSDVSDDRSDVSDGEIDNIEDTLNSEILDDENTLESDSELDIRGISSVGNKLTAEEKVLYAGIGVVGACNRANIAFKENPHSERVKKLNYEISNYMKVYIDAWDENKVNFGRAIARIIWCIGPTLFNKMNLGPSVWTDKQEVDNTSLMLLMSLSRRYAQEGMKSFQLGEIKRGLRAFVLDTVLFSEGDERQVIDNKKYVSSIGEILDMGSLYEGME